MKYRLVTEIEAEPLTLADAKQVLNVDENCTEFDELLQGYITAARQYVESKTNYKLGVAVIDCIFNKFESEMWLELAPIDEIDYIKYYDSANELKTLAVNTYESSLIEFPGRVKSVYGTSFPVSYIRYDAVTIRITTSDCYPKPLLTAMKMILGHWFENRQDVVVGHSANEIPLTSQHLCEMYRLPILR